MKRQSVTRLLVIFTFCFTAYGVFQQSMRSKPPESVHRVAFATIDSDFQQVGNVTEVIFSILTKFFVIVLVVIAMIFIVRVLADKSYSIRQINVPTVLDEAGHSGAVLANRIYGRLHDIIQKVNAMEYAQGYSTSSTESDVSVDLVGMGMPIKAFIILLGNAVGIDRKRNIDADVFFEGTKLVMTLRVSGERIERFETQSHENIGIPVKDLVDKAADAILKYSNDEVIQTYYGIIEQIPEKQIRLAKFRAEKYKDDPVIMVRVVAALAWGLCMLKKYDEAEKKLKEGIALYNKKPGRIYAIWGFMLQQQGKHEECLNKFEIALHERTRNESRFRIANVQAAMGTSHAAMGQIDIATEYFHKAMQTDSHYSRSYYAFAKVCLLVRNDRAKFFEMLETALSIGLKPKAVLNDPELPSMANDPELKMILEKYSDD